MNIIHGDCLEELKKLEDNSVDAVITDPPYGLSNTKPAQVADVLKAWVTGDMEAVPAKKGGFMGKDWDSFVPPPAVWEECMRVLKPGGHMAVFAGARTQDLMGLSIRLAGFEIRDTLGWVYGSGFPKSMDISKAIDKRPGVHHHREFAAHLKEKREAAGLSRQDVAERIVGTRSGACWNWEHHQFPKYEWWPALRDLLGLDEDRWGRIVAEADREVVGVRTTGIGTGKGGTAFIGDSDNKDITAPASDAAKRWDGWGTALKPAIEPIILARKPLVGTVAANVLAHGVGGLNIDACRVSGTPRTTHADGNHRTKPHTDIYGKGFGTHGAEPAPAGRFPANVLLDEHAAKEMDKQSGVLKTGAWNGNRNSQKTDEVYGDFASTAEAPRPADSGGASRFFPVFKYQAKAPKKERPVIYKNNCECEEWQSQQKDTTESTATAETSWNMSTSGNSTTEKCQKDTTSTTSTTISSTTGSKTSNASAGSTISESTQDAKSEMVNGGNHAESAESLSQSEQNIGISARRGGRSTDDAGHATSKKWYTTSECEKCGEPRLKVQHATVKPLALMEWLVELITPPNGVVLDPFAGSGTTLQAALNKGFTPIGIEQDADYIKLINKRLRRLPATRPDSTQTS